MICPFQWTEKDLPKPFSDSTPVRTRQFMNCVGSRCPAYIGEEIVKIGQYECYISEDCGMFPNDHENVKKEFAERMAAIDKEGNDDENGGA